jgi:hypothetical protein
MRSNLIKGGLGMRIRCLLAAAGILAACAPINMPTPVRDPVVGESINIIFTSYNATYHISLSSVERPKKASDRYGAQKIYYQPANKKYGSFFEDDLIKASWFVSSRSIAFLLQNKTDHSIKIPWDEAAFVDEIGLSHRVMHSGIKYSEREQPQAPSVIVRKGTIEDIVFPTDYVHWRSGSRSTGAKWEEQPFFPDLDIHGPSLGGKYLDFDLFKAATGKYVGKSIQILLPLQIENIINDYIFVFTIDSVSTREESKTI